VRNWIVIGVRDITRKRIIPAIYAECRRTSSRVWPPAWLDHAKNRDWFRMLRQSVVAFFIKGRALGGKFVDDRLDRPSAKFATFALWTRVWDGAVHAIRGA
jgi:hypothetical protein